MLASKMNGSKVCSGCADPACAAASPSPQAQGMQPRVVKGEAPPAWSQGALEAKEPVEEEKSEGELVEEPLARPPTLTAGASRWPSSPSPWPFPVLVSPESLGWKAACAASQFAVTPFEENPEEKPLARPQGAGVLHKGAGVLHKRQEMQQQHCSQTKAAEPQEAFIKPTWQCATPGCELADFHEGACTSQQVVGPRQRRPSVRKFGSTDGPVLGLDDAALGPATGASRKRKLMEKAPPSATSAGETRGSAQAAEGVTPEVEGPSFALRVWPPSPELSASGRLALAAIARAQEKWSRAATAAQRGEWAAPVPEDPEAENQAPSESPSGVRPPDLGSAEFQLLQVLRPLHNNTEQIYVTDPEGNCFTTTVPAIVAPGAAFQLCVPITNRAPTDAPRLAAQPR